MADRHTTNKRMMVTEEIAEAYKAAQTRGATFDDIEAALNALNQPVASRALMPWEQPLHDATNAAFQAMGALEGCCAGSGYIVVERHRGDQWTGPGCMVIAWPDGEQVRRVFRAAAHLARDPFFDRPD